MTSRFKIGWKVSTLNPDLASLRYRALLPILALERFDIQNKIFSRPSRACLTGLDALIIVKSFTLEDYWLAQEAFNMKVPVIFDLCDNIFIDQYSGKKHTSPADIFLLIASLASAIVVTTEPLATIVRTKIGDRIPVHVVPDGIETSSLLKAAKSRLYLPQLKECFYRLVTNGGFVKLLRQARGKHNLLKTSSLLGISRRLVKSVVKFTHNLPSDAVKLSQYGRRYLSWRFWAKLAYRHYDQIRAIITRSTPKLSSNVKSTPLNKSDKSELKAANSSPVQKIVWFGNHGADHAKFGMLDLLYIRESLEKLATEFDIELLVISNNLDKYKKYILPMAIPSRYIEWNADSMAAHLSSADVAVIPNSLDAFSLCKSANRSVLALMHGVPVVATLTPALEKLRGCIGLDDFESNLRRYLANPEAAKSDVLQGQKIIDQLYGQQIIGQLWSDIIDQAIHRPTQQDTLDKPELIAAIHLPQDIDLIRPVLDEAVNQGVHCVIWTSLAAVQRWPQLMDSIRQLGFNWHIFPDDLKGFNVGMFPDSVYTLLTVSETNLNPHRFTHQLTKLANSAGLFTATMQHGYENVGLNYSDDVHDIKHIKFAARKIYTWGHLETLDPNIHQQMFKKCFPVGCPKPEIIEPAVIKDWTPDGQPVIGIFENLHWHRYSDEYREFFLDGLENVAKAFPNVDFLIKPHNAGMWLTNRYKGELPKVDNLIIIDPKDPQWASVTAPQLLGHLAAVITTPSTVALDAARSKIPVSVVAHDLDLKNYEPLTLVKTIEDWHAFVNQAIETYGCQMLQEKSQKFVERVLLPGNAVSRIIKDIVSHKQERRTKNAA